MTTIQSLGGALCAAALVAAACGLPRAAEPEEPARDPRRAFLDNLRALCGRSFEGEATFTTPANEEMAGQRLVMHVADCREDQLRIPFHVGEDRSRTWILTWRDGGLLFKHDHRHPDGTPDEITDYGGWATADGTGHVQRFPADEETAALIPAAATNVWTLEIDAAGGRFIYDLQRGRQPRFRAEFRLED